MSALVLSVCVWLAAINGVSGAHAATALIMGGTGQPDPNQVPGYLDTVGRLYIDPASSCKVAACQLHGTVTTEEFSPFFTTGMTFQESVTTGVPMLDTDVRHYLALDGEPLVIFGNSQSATVATEEKRALAADPTVDPDRLQFVLVGDPNRPNGGFLQRFYPITIPIVGYRPSTSPVDTAGPKTTDISFQYDIAADFPTYPLDAFAMLNTIIGIGIHGSYTSTHDGYSEADLLAEINDPANRQIVGNTTYVTIPTKVLPLAQAIRDTGTTLGLGAITAPIADLLEPTLRVLVELGYDRTVGYGRQISFGLIPAVNPATVVTDLVAAAGEGISNAIGGIAARNAPPPPAAPQPVAAAALQASSPSEPPAVHPRHLGTDDHSGKVHVIREPEVRTVPDGADGTGATANALNDLPAQSDSNSEAHRGSTRRLHDGTGQNQSGAGHLRHRQSGSTADTSGGAKDRPAHDDRPSDHDGSADAA